MKNIKYWHVQLFQNAGNSMVMPSGVTQKLLHEGYSTYKPCFRHDSESTIELFTHPDQWESKLIRTHGIDTVLCTPVFEEEDEPLETEIENNRHALKSDFFTIEVQIPTAEDLNKIFADVCRSVSHLTPSHSVFIAVFEEVMKRVNASISASVTTNPDFLHRPHGMRGKQITPTEAPVHKADDKSSADFHEAKSRYDYNSFKSASKPLVKWLNENANPHASVIVEVDGATLYSAESHAPVREFIKD